MTIDDQGPNVGLSDLVIPIRRDPEFVSWANPIPPEWFSATAASYTLVDKATLYGSLVFARSYARNASDSLPVATDLATVGLVQLIRYGSDVVGVPEDVATTTRNFVRVAFEELPEPTDSAQRITQFGGMVNPMVDTWP